MITFLRSETSVNQFVARPTSKTEEEAIAFIDSIHLGIDKDAFLYWAITTKNQGAMIGTICLWNFSEDMSSAEVGLDLSPTY